MTRTVFTALVLALWIGLPAPGPAQDSTRARITLRSRQEWDVELLGRFHTDRVLLKRVGDAGAIDLPVKDIYRIDFPLGNQVSALVERFHAGYFAQVAPELASALSPCLPYVMDASSNMDLPLLALVKAWYWADNDPEALALCEDILSRTSRGPLHDEVSAFQLLSRVRSGQLEEAALLAESMVAPDRDQPEVAAYWYATASLQMAQQQLARAQESLARIIVFRSRDPEWMPPALLLSAEGYARANLQEVAATVVEEIRLNYPDSPWASRAAALDLDGLKPPANEPTPER